jgi:hypothetical protein
MGMKKCVFLFIMMNLIISGCATSSIKENYPIGKSYRDVFILEGKRVPLPEGEWKIAAARYRNRVQYIEVFLQKETTDHKFAGLVIVNSNTPGNNDTNYEPDEYADKKDILYASIKSNSIGKPLDFWLVDHYIFSLNEGAYLALKEYLEYLIDNGISVPKLTIQSYHLITGSGTKNGYLRVEYYYNPELEGFDLKNEATWGTSSWHMLRMNSDPKKGAYIENIKKQGEALHCKMREWF